MLFSKINPLFLSLLYVLKPKLITFFEVLSQIIFGIF